MRTTSVIWALLAALAVAFGAAANEATAPLASDSSPTVAAGEFVKTQSEDLRLLGTSKSWGAGGVIRANREAGNVVVVLADGAAISKTTVLMSCRVDDEVCSLEVGEAGGQFRAMIVRKHDDTTEKYLLGEVNGRFQQLLAETAAPIPAGAVAARHAGQVRSMTAGNAASTPVR